MASKATTRTYLISKAEVLQALQGLAPIPTSLSVKSFTTVLVLTGTMSASPSIFVDNVDITITKAEIATFVNQRAGTAFTQANVLGVTDGTDSSFYQVTVG